jgi:seryl-tRNA synthetase
MPEKKTHHQVCRGLSVKAAEQAFQEMSENAKKKRRLELAELEREAGRQAGEQVRHEALSLRDDLKAIKDSLAELHRKVDRLLSRST